MARPPQTACITLDLESDYSGRVPKVYDGWAPWRVDALLERLARQQVPLSIFVVGETLELQPQAIERFRRAGHEFHLHSFSHDLSQPDSAEEIDRGCHAFERCFGRRPEGYRAPEGRISPGGWARLEAAGFRFDSSVFPALWPAPRYARLPRRPFRPAGRRLLVLPLATVTPLRLVVGLSWIKLLGWPAYRALLTRARLPEPLVINMHLHDLWSLPAFERLGAPWRFVFGRNRERGLDLLGRLLDLLGERGYCFTTLGQVARELEAAC